MDTAHGVAAPALSGLTRSIREYSLFQGVMQVLDRLRTDSPELNDEALYERIEFQANPSMGFPGCDIEQVVFFHEQGELRARIRVNLIGLFGSGSPLPAFYSEQALGDGPNGNTTRDFLDLFNNRLQRLMLPIWRKYRYRAQFQRGASDAFSARLFALIGLGNEPLREDSTLDWKRLLPYLGLLSMRIQSAALLESVLRYYFKHRAMQIEECVERQVVIGSEQRNSLGLANSGLGSSLVLGEQVRDRSGKFRIHIRDLSWDRFHDFLPRGAEYQPLLALVRFSLRAPLAYDLRLQLRHEELRELRLGNDNVCRLGWTSWLGDRDEDAEVTLAGRTH
ncbi:MAG: type VI secretion system baseplate subunit TssG [Gammaproteobacteria bacterium HGW-Gammaproteobacteria-11]|nr:MAG: type VI secretion system baseplate subunit TssG [Gammaproteobacteria bacterium HGW-Gammaproteobacteria-11]